MENEWDNKDIIRWGIIGCGDVTEVKSGPPYQHTKGFELTAVMRRDAEKAADYARRHGVPKHYSDADSLIADPDIDAVYVATPPDTHAFYGLKIAAAGKPCCIEKPMAPSYEESLSLYKAFKEKDLPLFVAYYRRSLPRFEKVGEWLRESAIGEVRHLRWLLTKPPSNLDKSGGHNWRTDAQVAPGGYFDDLASHGLDLFCHWLGPISDAKGVAGNQLGLYSAIDAVTGCWMHANGVTGEGCWNFGSFEHHDQVEIIGDAGKITLSVFHDNPLVLETEGNEDTVHIDHPKHIQQQHVENMAKHLREGKPHPSTGESGLHTSWVMDRILGRI